MKAIILSAGFGSRMRPLTYYINKGMVPVGRRPLLEHIVTKLRDQGLKDMVIAVSHLHEQVEHHFGDGGPFGVRVSYSISTKPLGTAGELAHMRPLLEREESFLVHYGDILTNLDIKGMIAGHQADRERLATIGLVTNVPIHTGIATFGSEGEELAAFVEKPPLTQPCHAAVQIFRTRALDYMHLGEDIASDAIPAMLRSGERVCGFFDRRAYWYDVGRLSDLDEVNRLVRRRKGFLNT